MKATYETKTGLLSVDTSVGIFTESMESLTDTWLDEDGYTVNVYEFDSPKNPGNFIATLNEVFENGDLSEGLETCEVEII